MRTRRYWVIAFLFFLAELCVGAQSYPAPAPIERTFNVPDVSKSNISLQIKARDGRDLYKLQCHSAGYVGDPDFDYSGDFECRLSLSNGQNVYSTLLTEDLNQSRDWESRARFFAADLRGECARIPEFGSARNFTLRALLPPSRRRDTTTSPKISLSFRQKQTHTELQMRFFRTRE